MMKTLIILLCALGLPIAMSAQLQERKAGKTLDGMRTVNRVWGGVNSTKIFIK